jgi:hypothetical protein
LGVASGSRRRRPLWETVRSGDPEWAHQFLTRAYADHSVALSGDKAGFQFSHRLVRGDDRFSLARIRHSMEVVASVDPVEVVLAGQLHSGRLGMRVGDEHHQYRPGELFLYPPGRPVRVSWSRLSLTVVRFEPRALASYAASMVTAGSSGPGVKPPGPGSSPVPDWRSLFVGWRPVSAGMARYCRATVRHVLTAVLADPELAEDPVVLDAAYGQLAAAALATFANTAAALIAQAGSVSRTELSPTVCGPGSRSDTTSQPPSERIGEGERPPPIGPGDDPVAFSAPA